MAKYFKDFTFMGKKFKEQFPNYISLDFDENPEINLAMGREMDSGNTNRFRIEANYFGDKWSDGLEFQLHITKNPDKVSELLSMEITKEDIREITRWLTSPHSPTWIEFEYYPDDDMVEICRK